MHFIVRRARRNQRRIIGDDKVLSFRRVVIFDIFIESLKKGFGSLYFTVALCGISDVSDRADRVDRVLDGSFDFRYTRFDRFKVCNIRYERLQIIKIICGD